MLKQRILKLSNLVNTRVRRIVSVDGSLGYFIRILGEILLGKGSDSGINDLADSLDLPISVLKPWVKGLPDGYYYTTFKILKKNRRGHREINAPNHCLKAIQKNVYYKLLKPLNSHQAATAYITGKSILDNASPHVRQKVVVNIDLKDFFGSITSDTTYHYWLSLHWDVETAMILKNICCYAGSLPQGSPTSPSLSNLCNQHLDTRLQGMVGKNKGRYTRYSDDLTFSFSDPDIHRRGILYKIREILISQGYQIQEKKKIRVQRSHQRQTATGLIVNDKINLSKKMRKRIRAMRHHLSEGTLSEKDALRLAGYESLIKMVDQANLLNQPKRIELNRLVVSSNILLYKVTPSMKKILFLASNPIDSSRLSLDKEVHEIDEALRRSNNRSQFQLEPRWAIRADTLSRTLLDVEPQIVHFSGHGLGDNGIVLQDRDGLSKATSTEVLVRLFELCSGHVECVLLNACYSEIQAIAISQHIDYVIGMSQKIGDMAAIEFATGFYSALGAGKSIEVAFDFGCLAIQQQEIPEYLTPRLMKKSCA